MTHTLFQVGVKAVITDDEGRILIFKTGPFKEDPAHWDLPGGRIEDDQAPEVALRREILEETGITEVSDITFLGGCFSNIRIPVSPTEKVGLVMMGYRVKVPADSRITISDEHTEYMWAAPAEAAQKLGYKFPKEFTELLL